MTVQDAKNKLLAIAEAEIGYLEKASNRNLDSKTANAGSGNYTKYWRDVASAYQGSAWCACFVTWCLVRAFGKAVAEKVLKHYPYISCWKISTLHKLNANPQRGDIVIFYSSKKSFYHTGFVKSVNGDYFTTIEGNTSGGSAVIENGGGVCAKGYYNSRLPGTKFITLDWDYIVKCMNDKESEVEAMTATEKKEFEKLQKEIASLKEQVADRTGYYNYIDANMPKDYKPTIQKLVGNKLLQGNEKGELMLTTDMMRILTVLDRTGVFG